jgi:hypothetical protein
MYYCFPYLINTRLQPGGTGSANGQPFQRLSAVGKPLKRFWLLAVGHTGLKPGVNEKPLSFCEIQ